MAVKDWRGEQVGKGWHSTCIMVPGGQVKEPALGNLIHNYFFLHKRREERVAEDDDNCIGTKYK